MDIDIRKYHLAGAILVFVALPVSLFNLGEVPGRSLLKESLSLLTILAFSLMLAQFFLARDNQYCVRAFRFSSVLRVHKAIGYSVVGIFLIHPLLIVFPRFFESGISPVDALVSLLTTFETLEVVLGLIAWMLMLVIGVTSFFRDRLDMHYAVWKLFHGVLSMLFIAIASWHAIALGRHMDELMTVFVVVLAATGVVMLIMHHAPAVVGSVGEKQ